MVRPELEVLMLAHPTPSPARTLPLIRPDLPTLEDIEGPFREILSNGRITNFGKYNTAFEEESGRYLGARAATTSSGTAGMILTLKALGVEPGQKIILPSFTFMATAQAILYAGCQPVFAEVREDLNLCPDDLDRLLARHPDVAAVMPVHSYGLPAPVDAIQDIVDRHARQRGRPLRVLYDAAHAFGSAIDGRKVGGFGDAEVFSLSVTKILVSVEGGMVTSRDPELIRRVQRLRNYGIEENYDAHFQGLNGKMSEFHAIVGLFNLRRLDTLLQQRQEKARYYIERIEAAARSRPLVPPAGVRHTFKDFTVVLPREWQARRGALMAALKQRGVETRAYFYPPVHEQTCFRRYADRPLPVTEELARRVLTLPFYTTMTTEEMDYAAAMLAEAERAVA
jgi:dTDP-4-amino-4,6-dideoxygalactose transaminase